MMAVILVVVVLLFIGGIILLGTNSPHEKKTREQYLQELVQHLEGTLESIEEEGYQNSFRIRFRFSGEDFVFEDLEKQGFKDKVYIGLLKIKTPSTLTLTFTEKKRSTKITTDIFLASEVSTQRTTKYIPLQAPKFLSNLNIFTNEPNLANVLFDDKKICGALKKFKNIDSRGYPFLSIGIIDGTIILEFHSERAFHPSLSVLQSDIASIEDYLQKLLVIVRRLKQVF